MLLLRRELGDAVGHVARVEQLRHAEVEVAARLLREEVLAARLRYSGSSGSERHAHRVGDVHVRIRQSRRQEFSRPVQSTRVRGCRDGFVADGSDTAVANQNVAVAERLSLIRR